LKFSMIQSALSQIVSASCDAAHEAVDEPADFS
jgi:hypothetical protein